jgi:hypothetical protein
MPEVLILTRAGKHESDERYSLVEIDVSTARVGRVAEAISGDAVRALLEARGEPQWCIGAKLGLARLQMSVSDCGASELAMPPSLLKGATIASQGERSMAARRVP